MSHVDFAIGIGGENGQGIATSGNVLARIFARRGLHFFAYNAYQSIIRGGHTFLTLRASEEEVLCHGDRLDALLCLNQDTMDRHLRLMKAGSSVLFDSEKVKPGTAADGVQLCAIPAKQITPNRLLGNTVALGATLNMLGIEFSFLEEILTVQFRKKGDAVIAENVGAARGGYEYAAAHFKPWPRPLPKTGREFGVITGNEALAMGGAAAGVNFYAAYPMSPATGVLVWFAKHARELGIMVRQVEDEISVANMIIGAGHAGCRAMCATSGGGFALMTEAFGAAAMMEIPVVGIDVQRAGPATGVPTKTEQGDLWQMLGAGQGDYPRAIVSVSSSQDAFDTVPELFNLLDRFHCPGIILSDLLVSEGTSSVDPAALKFNGPIDRGPILFPKDVPADVNPTSGSNDRAYLRYKITESGVSPRAVPGTPGHLHVVASDEHDEDGVLISDEFTNPKKRRAMHEKRMRKVEGMLRAVAPPRLFGAANAEVTLVGWGSTLGVIREAIARLATEEKIIANHLHIKWLVPFHAKEILDALVQAKRAVIVENSISGQFARYLRSETGFSAHGHIRKYDGEPFTPRQLVAAVKEQLAGKTTLSVPEHEISV
ncbi:MAG: 2-oxoacid:acceptor oxidoreductase subunit alpha [Verrucomicrobiae bacterium]|nr:2-oxoacid:acceptor oxidoreductase subunit alpha [Verrucomicrobiae bacterium]